ncbi:MAG: DMT family transporter [Gemmatimonadetes bacterium]|nr:DMT family transporter [Gemmatimonadota bacterium]
MKRSLWLAVGAAAMFGTSYGAAKIATEELAPMGAVLLRYVFGTLFLGVLVATTRRGRVGGVRRRAPWPALLAMAVFGLVGYQTFFFASLRYTAVFNTALINALSPVITGLLAAAFLRERLPRRSWAGIALVVLGVVTLLSRGNPARLLALELNRGDALMLGAVTSFAIHSLVVRRVAGASSLVSSFHATILGTGLLAGMARAFEGWPSLHVSPRIWIALVWMGIAASGIGFVLFNRSVTENGPTRTSAFVYGLVPLFVALLGWILFREIPGPSAIVATVLVLAGLAWTARDGR